MHSRSVARARALKCIMMLYARVRRACRSLSGPPHASRQHAWPVVQCSPFLSSKQRLLPGNWESCCIPHSSHRYRCLRPYPPGLDLLAAAASSPQVTNVSPPVGQPATSALTGTGPYNPAASLPPKVVRRILNLEFVEMSELTGDIWVDDSPATDQGHPTRRSYVKPPITCGWSAMPAWRHS